MNGDMGKEDEKGWSSGTETLEEMSDMERTEEGKRTGEDTVSRPLPSKTQESGPPASSPSDPGIRAPSSLLPESLESAPHSLLPQTQESPAISHPTALLPLDSKV